ncbi:MAG: TetR/AcrR family transcriptional regulator [Vulcanimicrobiaceae bacterium]
MRATYHHGDLRETLLATAREVALASGVASLSLREVSRRAGVSHAAAYNHFASRSALIEALVVHAFDRFREALEGAERRTASPLGRLENIGVAYVRFACDHPAEFRLMFRPEFLPATACAWPMPIAVAGNAAYAVLERAVAAARASGEIVHEQRSATLSAWSVVHGLATLIVDGPTTIADRSPEAIEALARSVTAIHSAGMRVRPEG